jgi:DnaJ family protein A protein 2
MVVDKTLYDRLEIESNASQEDIKKKSRKLLVKWHPDKNPNNMEEATQKFQEIQEALEILGDPEKRQMYDNIGMNYVKGDNSPDMSNPFGAGFPFGEMFSQSQRQHQQKENLIVKLNVTLEQIYKQETVELTYTHKVYCVKCNGEGSKDNTKSECNDCDGKGRVIKLIRMGPMIQQIVINCESCKGKGSVILENNKCEVCNGNGIVTKEKTISIPLKNGFGNGIKLQKEGKGHHFKNQKTDLVIVINEEPHDIFKRRGNDLFVEVTLKLYQALFGFDKILVHLDGKKLHLHCTGKTDFNSIKKISQEGMVDLRTGVKGDLIIKFNIELPTITNETLIKELTLLNKNESIAEKNVLQEKDLVKTLLIDIQDTVDSASASASDSDENSREHTQQIPDCKTQ